MLEEGTGSLSSRRPATGREKHLGYLGHGLDPQKAKQAPLPFRCLSGLLHQPCLRLCDILVALSAAD